MTEQGLKEKRKKIDRVLCQLCNRCDWKDWEWCKSDCQALSDTKSKLSSLGVVTADKDAELQCQHIDNPFLGKLIIASEEAIVGYTKTHSLLKETKASLIKDASEVTAIWDLTEGMNPVDFVREMREDKEALDEQDR